MQRSSFPRKDRFRLNSFTLIELLTVIAIIAILAGLTLAAMNAVQKTALRNRARDEIAGIGNALESYKIDNGAYPQVSFLLGPPGGAYPYLDGQGGLYQQSSQVLYQALASKQYYTDATFSSTAPATGKPYMTFKTGQLGSYKQGSGPTYVQDPFGFSYGYSTGDALNPQVQAPFSGTGFFDLWSTGGTTQPTTANPNPTKTWISNWPQ
jgi:prepilin-type N-terminal cleavage/methylation domain-containing protein